MGIGLQTTPSAAVFLNYFDVDGRRLDLGMVQCVLFGCIVNGKWCSCHNKEQVQAFIRLGFESALQELCNLGKLFNFSESRFPHPQIEIIIMAVMMIMKMMLQIIMFFFQE